MKTKTIKVKGFIRLSVRPRGPILDLPDIDGNDALCQIEPYREAIVTIRSTDEDD